MKEGITQIRYYNRLSGKIEDEKIYGEAALRWAYFNPVGKIITHFIVKNPLVSRLYGWLMDRPGSQKKIQPFLEQYKVDTGEFLEPADSFPHFNAFFYRKLKPESRPIDNHEVSVSFPADGRHLAVENIQTADTFYAKGQVFFIELLMVGTPYGHSFEGGSLLISRLCPVDYHRFHAPFSGEVMKPIMVGESLYSVSPLALSQKLDYLINNRRWIIPFKLESGKLAALVVIGATFVGSAEFTYNPGFVKKGQELGFFRFGGSCVVTAFPHGSVIIDPGLLEHSRQGMESYDKMGRPFGILC
ncbi:MAG: phosphatidylserine decarboxylase [Verrucomicrobia bacterium]|nr:phosphatidylserine decarboxylase [Verrucomicrobiota bacterium]MDA1068126.1 phosphatidylserine decarboxylase [Verrucomicrobiota bacterium]